MIPYYSSDTAALRWKGTAMSKECVTASDCVTYKGHQYEFSDEVNGLLRDLEWADKIIAAPDATALNGRSMHEIAWEVYEKVQDALIDHERFRA